MIASMSNSGRPGWKVPPKAVSMKPVFSSYISVVGVIPCSLAGFGPPVKRSNPTRGRKIGVDGPGQVWYSKEVDRLRMPWCPPTRGPERKSTRSPSWHLLSLNPHFGGGYFYFTHKPIGKPKDTGRVYFFVHLYTYVCTFSPQVYTFKRRKQGPPAFFVHLYTYFQKRVPPYIG